MNDDISAPSAWDWLADTYWYCPTAWLPALLHTLGDTLVWIDDQTVWHVTGSSGGYFWGRGAALISGERRAPAIDSRSELTFVASVTPEGRVHISFLMGRGEPTIAVGVLEGAGAQARFIMQMSSGRAAGLAVHHATMLPVREGDPAWDQLPGAGVSVSELLAGIKPPQVRRGTAR
jgi:hypothetical protein